MELTRDNYNWLLSRGYIFHTVRMLEYADGYIVSDENISEVVLALNYKADGYFTLNPGEADILFSREIRGTVSLTENGELFYPSSNNCDIEFLLVANRRDRTSDVPLITKQEHPVSLYDDLKNEITDLKEQVEKLKSLYGNLLEEDGSVL